MTLRNILLLIILTGFLNLNAQDEFHRSYPTNMLDNIHLLDGFTVSGGNYIMLGAFLSDDLTEYDAYMLASLDYKGNLNWQKKLEGVPEAPIGTVSGRVIIATDANIYYSLSFDNNGTPYRLVGSYEAGTGIKGIQRSYDFDSDLPPANVSVEDFKDDAFLQAGNYRSDGLNSGFYLGKTNYGDGDFQWLDAYNGSDTLNNVLALVGTHEIFKSLIDSSIVMSSTATLEHTGNVTYPVITKLDSSGVMGWSRYYRPLSTGNTSISVLDHYELGDSSIVMVGAITSSTFTNGFVARLDTAGQVVWAKQVSQGADVITVLDHVTPGADGTVVSGKGLYTARDTTYDFHLLLNDSGLVIRSAEYNPLPSFFGFYGDLFTTANGGSAYFTTQLEGDEFVPAIIQTNRELITTCEDSLTGLSIIDLSMSSDTLVWEKVAVTPTIEEVEIADTSIFSFNVPILTLESIPFCPSEPIDHTFDPNVEGAVAYLWNTGATSDTLRVMEEGDYSVTVTVADKVCFTVCDTGRITQYERPEIDMAQSLAPFCETGQLGVLFQYLMDAPIAMIEWSTGEENVDNILVSEIGTYGVTVTDICEEVAMEEIDVDEFPQLITEVTVDVDDDFCDDGFITLRGEADATINSAFWSNGGAGQSILVNEAGTYTITVTDICDNEYEATGTVNPAVIVEPITALAIAPIGGDCVLQSLDLNASFAGQAGSIEWSTGQSDQVITVTEPGTYSVTVTDLCGNAAAPASITLEECPECITYPRVFFPRGEEEKNKTFGPILNCGDVITNYELKIYNRWGNLVFESNNVETEWNGRHGDDEAETGVYVYFARYDAGLGEQTTKGDVTLIR
jgi:gliding motility-associated-like protein